MALTATARHSANTGTGASVQTVTTDSQTPTASSELFSFFAAEADSATVTPAVATPTGGGLTYTLVAKAGESPTIPYDGNASFNIAGGMFRATVGGSPSAFAITGDVFSGATVGWYSALSCDITGHSSSTPVQVKAGGATVTPASSSASVSLILDSTPVTVNEVLLAVFSTADTGGPFATPTIGGQNFTAIGTPQNNSGYTHAGLWKRPITGAESNKTITVSNLGNNVGSYLIVAAEIPVAGAAAYPFVLLTPTPRVY